MIVRFLPISYAYTLSYWLPPVWAWWGGFCFTDGSHPMHHLACGQEWQEGSFMASGWLLTPGDPRYLATWALSYYDLPTSLSFLHVPPKNHADWGALFPVPPSSCLYYFRIPIFISVQNSFSEHMTFGSRPEGWQGALDGELWGKASPSRSALAGSFILAWRVVFLLSIPHTLQTRLRDLLESILSEDGIFFRHQWD